MNDDRVESRPCVESRPYVAPAIREMTEDEVLGAFQMTAAEISAASCWWTPCASGCP